MQETETNKTGFELFSDRYYRQYPTYQLDDRLRVMPGPDTETVNFAKLKEILLSKDLSRNEELAWISKGLRFFDGKSDLTGHRICFSTFPRTGNTMTRKTIETVCGIYSGSDMDVRLTC
jgi:hypothetical protein